MKTCLITEANFGEGKENPEVLGKDREEECFKDPIDPSQVGESQQRSELRVKSVIYSLNVASNT